jgi:GT2 family glycosyltransferase/glycosyltransferase involved in cell wall biosynthesis
MILLRFIGTLLLCLISPVLLLLSGLILAATDLCFAVFGSKRLIPDQAADNSSATVVIPNWNGRDLLEKYLPSVIAAMSGHPGNEIIVVDNASADGSAEFLAWNFPGVRVIRCEQNLGFGGGSNLGFREAKNDIVVLLNSDMRVDEQFLAPLLAPFADPQVFSVSCQIFFSNPNVRREETGLTQGWWSGGRLRVSHKIDDQVKDAFPCFYGGGGSSAYDRRKFLQLGGFDELLRPFYYEDTDLGYMAWKRGWKVFYQPRSIVFHEHRGTIGKKFTRRYIDSVLKKNSVLILWKNVHDWRLLPGHLLACFSSSLRSFLFGDAPGAFSFPGLTKAFLQIGSAARARWRARSLAAIDDRETFLRPLGTYFRDRFEAPLEPVPSRLRVLFAAPYPIEPPVHGGAVFMKLTMEELAPLADIHLVGMVDRLEDLPNQACLKSICASVYMQVRQHRPAKDIASLLPHAVREFEDDEFAWALHRTAYQKKINVVQLEYTQLAQYAGRYRRIPCFLFEHDIYFQSIERQLAKPLKWQTRLRYFYEYLRALRYELATLPNMTRVQVCSEANAKALTDFKPSLRSKLDSNLRAGIQTQRYRFASGRREPDTMLFVGSFRHGPNLEALRWLVTDVLPRIISARPGAKLVIVGSDPPPSMAFLADNPGVMFTGYVEDIRDVLERYAVFVCPILTGSGIRVKLLEAFAAGIPAVSTAVGAEGLSSSSGDVCEIADTPEAFAAAVVHLFNDGEYAAALAQRARRMVETEKDGASITAKLAQVYRREVFALRNTHQPKTERKQ